MNTEILEIIYETDEEIKIFYNLMVYKKIKYIFMNGINYWTKFNYDTNEFDFINDIENNMIEEEYNKYVLYNNRIKKLNRII